MQRSHFLGPARHSLVIVMLLLRLASARAQDAKPDAPPADGGPVASALRELQAQVRELQSAMVELKTETARYRAETLQVRRELQAARAQLSARGSAEYASSVLTRLSPVVLAAAAPQDTPVAARPSENPGNEDRLAKLEEEHELLSAKVDEQHQTKVESASKYRVRLSGIALLNLFSNAGTVDNQDVPTVSLARGATDSHGSFGATVRQSQLGLEVFGPEFGGARTSADVQFDFAGGFPNALNGVNSGLVRLRTATLRMDWSRTSLVAGQDNLFFSPLTPTSIASLATPALSYAGNLWSWTPQVRVEHRLILSDSSSFTLQGGILDPLSGEPPTSLWLRTPVAGEKSRQPGYATRVAWSHGASDRSFTLGVGGYYSRQHWGFDRNVDSWAAMTDWSLPLTRSFALSGEFYRGRAIGGLGGGVGRSVLANGPLNVSTTVLRPLNALGGWTQLKFRPASTVEFNAAVGQDNPLARDLRSFSVAQSSIYPPAARNRSSLVNFIYRPRSDLVFSAEYRRLWTYGLRGTNWTADHLNLMMGILF